MVLISRTIPPIQHGNALNVVDTNKEKVTDAVLQFDLVGLINQLFALSNIASDVFSNVLKDSSEVANRITLLGGRTTTLLSSMDSVKSRFERGNILEEMSNNIRTDYHAANPENHQHFTHEKIPLHIKRSYDTCQVPPNLSLLDPYMDDGQQALKLYTNPQFFLDEWIAEQNRLREEARGRRREKRAKRRADKVGDGRQSVGPQKVKRMQKIRYDQNTGEKIVEYETTPVMSVPAVELHTSSSFSLGDSSSGIPAPFQNAPDYQSLPSMPPPPPMFQQQQMAPPPAFQPRTAIPSPMFPPPSVVPNNQPPQPPMYQQLNAPPPMMANTPPPPPPPPSNSPAPPPPPKGAPPPPPPPAGFKGPSMGGLADHLSAGTQLKSVEQKPRPVDAQSELLSSIIRGKNLKSAAAREEQAPAASKPDTSVAAILARRIAIAESDSDDDEDSDDDDWN